MKMLANMVHIWGDAMLQVSCKFAWSIWNPYWLIVLMSSSESDYVPNEHEDVDKYGYHLRKCHVKTIL